MAIRNPLIRLNQNGLQNIGDAHLGRVFKTNVALHRRGEYEKKQMNTFKELLFAECPDENPTGYIKVQVGDLFDKAVVSNQVVLDTIKLLQEFEEKGQEIIYIISGNHDDSKSITEPTSWDILAKFFHGSDYVRFVKTWEVHTFPDQSQVLFVGWNIHQSVAQAYLEAEKEGYDPDVVVCHLDKISYGNDDNVIPYDFLKSKGVSIVISGHEHKPYHFTEGNMQVIGTGSLLPYSHAEDPEGKNYITFRNFDDVKDFIDEYPEGLKDMHVRVYIEDERMDEFLALDLDTVSLQVNKLEQLDVDEGVTEVVTESYDAKTIWSQSVAETGLDKEQAELLWADIEAKGIENE